MERCVPSLPVGSCRVGYAVKPTAGEGRGHEVRIWYGLVRVTTLWDACPSPGAQAMPRLFLYLKQPLSCGAQDLEMSHLTS